MLRASLLHSRPRRASVTPFLRLMRAQCECPAISELHQSVSSFMFRDEENGTAKRSDAANSKLETRNSLRRRLRLCRSGRRDRRLLILFQRVQLASDPIAQVLL